MPKQGQWEFSGKLFENRLPQFNFFFGGGELFVMQKIHNTDNFFGFRQYIGRDIIQNTCCICIDPPPVQSLLVIFMIDSLVREIDNQARPVVSKGGSHV